MIDNFQTAVITARRLVLHFKRRNSNSLPYPVPVEPVSVSNGWGETQRPSSILKSAEELWGWPITCDIYPAIERSPLQACVMIYPESAEIYVSRDQNFCWRRFLVVKEICHILMGHSSNFTPVTPDDIEGLISDVLNNVVCSSSEALKVEFLAYVAAIEVLLPQEHVNEAVRLVAKGCTTLQVADFFKMPARFVEWRMSDRFKDEFSRVYGTIGYEHVMFNAVQS